MSISKLEFFNLKGPKKLCFPGPLLYSRMLDRNCGNGLVSKQAQEIIPHFSCLLCFDALPVVFVDHNLLQVGNQWFLRVSRCTLIFVG